MNNRVVITGMGLVTPLGHDLNIFYDNLVSGKSGISIISSFDSSEFPTQIAGEIKDFQPENYMEKKDARRMDRFIQLAVAASSQAIQDADLKIGENVDPRRVGVIIGSGYGGVQTWEEQMGIIIDRGPKRVSPFFVPMIINNMASGIVSIIHGAKGPNTSVVTACASGAHSIGEAYRIIQRGEADVMICGGTEAAIRPTLFADFSYTFMSKRNEDPERASRPFDKDRDGFVMSEGAGIIILESLEHAKNRNARIYAEIAGFGSNTDVSQPLSPAPSEESAARCMSLALKDAEIEPHEVDYINAHGISSPVGDRAETNAIKTVFGEHAYHLVVNSTKSMTGHLLGASGGVEAIICCLVINNQIIPPTINLDQPDPDCDLDYVPNYARKANVKVALSNSFSYGGHNATLIFKKL